MSLLFVFDLDDTLFDYDWRQRMAALTELTGHDLGELRRRWWNLEGEGRAEAGGYPDGAAYLAAANAALERSIGVADWLAARRSAMTPRPGALAAVARASELGRVSVLTNNGPLIHERLSELVPELVPLFGREHLRASASYGARKPDPEVYRAMLRSYDARPEDTFFADDLPENIASAAGLGITAHLYRDPGALRAAIEEFAASRVRA
ncbi:MAG: HAD-IA family hydrolase [Micrococcales bacterium]|nr:HAD-IA family hydrolase [Micrococcales bacterium]